MRSGQAGGVRYGPAPTSEKITLELPPARWEQQTKPERGGRVGVIFYWDLELGNKAIVLIPMPLAVENLVDCSNKSGIGFVD